mmetsp:Transcript_12825/g.14726  ORF Transcript_12825/g.14726 Transcript_12825/m.14726 type:complete len:228 (-) Transcript_12825:136-819(-)
MEAHDPNDTYIYGGADGEYIPKNARKVDYTTNITVIKKEAAIRCKHITSVVHPDSVIAIEACAYYGCSAIRNLRFSSTLQTIGDGSFDGCSSITTLEMPPTLHTIDKWGFESCSSLRMITPQDPHKPLCLKTIKDNAFFDCESLASLPYFPLLKIIGSYAFGNCTSLTEVTLGSHIISAARDCFDDCDSLIALHCTYRTYVILPWMVTHVTIDPDTTLIHPGCINGM